MRIIPSVLLAGSLLFVPGIAIAQPLEPDFICYMKGRTGQVQDLTASLCGAISQVYAPTPAATSPMSRASSSSRASTPSTSTSTPSRTATPDGTPQFRTGNGRITISPFLNGKSYSCSSFTSKAQAQEILTHDPKNDPFNLDPDRNMMACDGMSYGTSGGNTGTPGYTGNCPTPDSIAADGKRCGKRAASERPGGY